MHDQAIGLRLLAKKKKTQTKTIVVTSGKGGVGKTFFTVNLAIALSERGKQVAILDADLGLANVDLLMGIHSKYNLLHFLEGERRLSEVITQGPKGVKLIPGGSGVMEIANLNEVRLQGLIESLGILDEFIDYLVIDTGAGISKQVLAFALAADEVFVLTTPDPTSLADSYGVIKIMHNGNPNIPINIVVNQADNQAHGRQVYKRMETVCLKFVGKELRLAGVIPSDNNVVKAIRNQEPLVLYNPISKAAIAINNMATDYLASQQLSFNEDQETKGAKGFKGLFEKMARLLR